MRLSLLLACLATGFSVSVLAATPNDEVHAGIPPEKTETLGRPNPQVTAAAADADERVFKALGTLLESLDGKEHSLNEMLALFAATTKENFVLDPNLPKSTGEIKMTLQARKGGTVLDALGVALTLSGLRYTITEGLVFVSSEDLLAHRLLNGRGLAAPAADRAVRQPLSTGDAAVKLRPFDRYQDEFYTAENFINQYPHRLPEPPRLNAETGLVDYPGPPVWIDSPDVGHPRFKYSTQPYFLKPEYLDAKIERAEYAAAIERSAALEQEANKQALQALLKLMKEQPNLTSKEILEKLSK